VNLALIARLFLDRALLHLGWGPAGRRLVKALGVRDENARVIAGMFLVKEAPRSVPYLRDALHHGENLEMTLTILADIGDRSVVPSIRELTNSKEPLVARTARDALKRLEESAG
jgi:hypothetical protein